MTIKELKEKIANLDDNMLVGGSGYFGEFLECYNAEVTTVMTSYFDFFKGIPKCEIEIFCISIQDKGEEPD